MILLLLACPGDPADTCSDDGCPDSGDSRPVDTVETDTDTDTTTSGTGPDADGDGWRKSLDCDDDDENVHPGQTEVCYDDVDNNCSGDPDDCGWIGDMQVKTYGHPISGEATNDAAGIAVAAGGDVNGDGLADVIVGAPDHTDVATACGAVYVVAGPITEETPLSTTGWARITGADDYGYALGSRVLFAPDLDGDGVDDVIAVAGRVSEVDDEGRRSPAVFLLSGATSGDMDIDDFAPLEAASDHDGAGVDLAVSADLDGDGGAELLLGAPDGDGAVWWLSGPVAGGSVADGTAVAGGPGFGSAVAFVGDLDGDGVTDWAASATEGEAAGVHVFDLAAASTDDAFALIAGDDATTWGSAPGGILGAGDLDADGRDDLVLADPEATVGEAVGAGRVCVWSGTAVVGQLDAGASSACYSGGHDDEAIGTSISSPGDVDSDGLPDLMVGSPGNSAYETNIGAVLVFAGPPAGDLGSSDSRAIIYGETSWQLTGQALSDGAELTGDDATDIVIGAPGASAAIPSTGVAFVFPGIIP